MRRYLRLLAAVVLLTACGVGEVSQVPAIPARVGVDVDRAVEVGSGTDTSDWSATWEEAARAEALRRHPELRNVRAERFLVAPEVGVRVRVTAAGGYCGVYGGMSLDGRWRANETGRC